MYPAVRDSMPPLDSMTFTKQDSSRDRYFEAYYHVRIFSDRCRLLPIVYFTPAWILFSG